MAQTTDNSRAYRTVLYDSGLFVPLTASNAIVMCDVCNKRETDVESAISSGWRVAVGQNSVYFTYICPEHFPPLTADPGEFKKAYFEIMRAIFER